MYENFTDRARKVMALATQEAQRLNHEYLGTEHILLGLVKEESSTCAVVLRYYDVTLRTVRLEVEKLVKSGPDQVTIQDLPLTPRAKVILQFAVEEATRLSHNYVGTEHLLLGILREKESIAAQVLINLDLEEIREKTFSHLGKNETVLDLPEQKPSHITPADRVNLQEILSKILADNLQDKDITLDPSGYPVDTLT